MSMSRLAAAMLAGVATAGFAAAAQAQVAAEPFNGFYVGAVAGYTDMSVKAKSAPLFAASNSNFFGPFSGLQANSAPRFKAEGMEYGGTVGWNYQRGALVGGFEADAFYPEVDSSLTIADRPQAGTNRFNTRVAAYLRYSATARARLGYAMGPAMIYGTGGFAMQNVLFSRGYANRQTGRTIVARGDRTMVGFAYGGGAEVKVTPRISVKAEYLRLDMGSELFRQGYNDVGNATNIGSTSTAKIEANRDSYRVGVNFAF